MKKCIAGCKLQFKTSVQPSLVKSSGPGARLWRFKAQVHHSVVVPARGHEILINFSLPQFPHLTLEKELYLMHS